MGDRFPRRGAAAGAVAVVLYVAGALVIGTPPDFGAPASAAVAYFEENRTRIQLGSAVLAAATPFLVWWLATVASLASDFGPAARRAGAVAFGCGIAFVALFMADVAALAVGALRPGNMAAAPELAQALLDFSFLAMGTAAFLAAGVLAACAVLALRDAALWPRWIGWAAAVAAPAYALRVGTLFATDGPFAADGVLGLWVPVIAFAGWIFAASVMLARGSRS